MASSHLDERVRMLGWTTTWVGTAVAVGATVAAARVADGALVAVVTPVLSCVVVVGFVLAAGVAVLVAAVVERLSSQD
jgi:hypothetical protein